MMKRRTLLFAMLITVILLSLTGCLPDQTSTDDTGHEYSEWTLTKAATCTEKGEEKRSCKNCESYETREVAAKGHEYNEWALTQAPTCTEKGEEKRSCKNCESYETREIAAKGHEFGEWTLTQAPTCTEKGEEKRSCKNCESYETREIAAKGHEFVDGVCKYCNKKEYSDGLLYTLTSDSESYYVSGIGSCTDADIVIPSAHNGKPVTGIGKNAFKNCHSITGVTIGSNVTHIGENAFYHCTGLTSIEMPVSVTAIDAGAFKDCKSLTRITIPSSVTSIGESAFEECTNLTGITIPDSVTSIGTGAFRNCKNLSSITLGNSVTSIGAGAFYNTAYYNSNDHWEEGVLYIGNYPIKAKSNSNILPADYTIKAGAKCIAEYAFEDCKRLTSITIPDSVVSIGAGAFYNCTGMTSITIPDSVVSIGFAAFGKCSELSSITIPDSLTSIDNGVFYYTAYYNNPDHWVDGVLYIGNHLIEAKPNMLSAEYTVKAGTKCIAGRAFEACSNLTSITIPDSVVYIGGNVFENCRGLTSIRFNGTTSQWNRLNKGDGWNNDTGDYTIYCTDGTISK